jgi:hypothetical protein
MVLSLCACCAEGPHGVSGEQRVWRPSLASVLQRFEIVPFRGAAPDVELGAVISDVETGPAVETPQGIFTEAAVGTAESFAVHALLECRDHVRVDGVVDAALVRALGLDPERFDEAGVDSVEVEIKDLQKTELPVESMVEATLKPEFRAAVEGGSLVCVRSLWHAAEVNVTFYSESGRLPERSVARLLDASAAEGCRIARDGRVTMYSRVIGCMPAVVLDAGGGDAVELRRSLHQSGLRASVGRPIVGVAVVPSQVRLVTQLGRVVREWGTRVAALDANRRELEQQLAIEMERATRALTELERLKAQREK